MRRSVPGIAVLLVLGLVLAACGDDDGGAVITPTTAAPSTSSATTTSVAPPATSTTVPETTTTALAFVAPSLPPAPEVVPVTSSTAFVTFADGTVARVDLATGDVVATAVYPVADVVHYAFGSLWLASCAAGTLTQVAGATLDAVGEWDLGGCTSGLASSEGVILAALPDAVVSLDPGTGERATVLDWPGLTAAAAGSPLVVGDGNGNVVCYERMADGALIERWRLSPPFQGQVLAATIIGPTLYVLVKPPRGPAYIAALVLETGRMRASGDDPTPTFAGLRDFLATARWAYTIAADGSVWVHDFFEPGADFQVPIDGPQDAAAVQNPDGSQLVAVLGDDGSATSLGLYQPGGTTPYQVIPLGGPGGQHLVAPKPLDPCDPLDQRVLDAREEVRLHTAALATLAFRARGVITLAADSLRIAEQLAAQAGEGEAADALAAAIEQFREVIRLAGEVNGLWRDVEQVAEAVEITCHPGLAEEYARAADQSYQEADAKFSTLVSSFNQGAAKLEQGAAGG